MNFGAGIELTRGVPTVYVNVENTGQTPARDLAITVRLTIRVDGAIVADLDCPEHGGDGIREIRGRSSGESRAYIPCNKQTVTISPEMLDSTEAEILVSYAYVDAIGNRVADTEKYIFGGFNAEGERITASRGRRVPYKEAVGDTGQ